MMRYVCSARVRGKDWVFLWEGDGDVGDRIIADDHGHVIVYQSELAARQSESISPDPVTRYDFDAIERWCNSSDQIQEFTQLLNAWNLLVDMPTDEASLFRAADRRAISVYEKLILACNLPSITRPGQEDRTPWTHVEIDELRRVLMLGLAEFRARLV
jgi:hypothetical protein